MIFIVSGVAIEKMFLISTGYKGTCVYLSMVNIQVIINIDTGNGALTSGSSSMSSVVRMSVEGVHMCSGILIALIGTQSVGIPSPHQNPRLVLQNLSLIHHQDCHGRL